MNAIDAYWTPKMNILKIECDCGNIIHHELRHSLVSCPKCRKVEWYAQEYTAFNDKYTVASVINWTKFKRSGASVKINERCSKLLYN